MASESDEDLAVPEDGHTAGKLILTANLQRLCLVQGWLREQLAFGDLDEAFPGPY